MIEKRAQLHKVGSCLASVTSSILHVAVSSSSCQVSLRDGQWLCRNVGFPALTHEVQTRETFTAHCAEALSKDS